MPRTHPNPPTTTIYPDDHDMIYANKQSRTDKLDEVHPGEPAGSIRGQVIGLLNAIQYLKRACVFCFCYGGGTLVWSMCMYVCMY